MKKYLFIAAAAVVASVACSKVEDNFNEADPSNKVAFEVANYASPTQTKADETSLASEGFYSFHTYANQFPTIGNPVTFMSNVEVKAWDNSAQAVTSGNGIYSWAPAVDYYWPKTGYINFYSYAGSQSPDVTIESDKKTVTFAYTDKVIGEDDNILVADAALHFNQNTENYKKDNVTKGVPTLFRHQLAKVTFTVHLKTTQSASDNTIWTVRTINSEEINSATYASTVTVVKKGSLTLKNADGLEASAALNATEQSWTADPTGNVSGWVASTEATDVEVIPMTSQTLTIPLNATESNETNTAYLIAERSVMPQVTSGTKFVLYYEVTATHDGESDPFLKEVRSVGVDPAKTLANLVSTIDDWPKNTKITYNIIIDPVSEKVTFDPAVEKWAEESGTINVPLS